MNKRMNKEELLKLLETLEIENQSLKEKIEQFERMEGTVNKAIVMAQRTGDQMITERAYAKINLCLDVTGKRPDGYHDVRMIMQTVDIYDILSLEKTESGITIDVGGSPLPADGDNLIYKAAKKVMDKCGIQGGISISLEKHIPIAAGMAGGSSDAAATLRGVNRLYELGYDTEKLCELGVKLGADVPFCIRGGTAMAEGIGDKLTPLPTPDKAYILLVKPPIAVSTKEVYEAYDALEPSEREDKSGRLEKLLKEGKADPAGVCGCLMNVLADVTEAQHPMIKEIREKMTELGAEGALMSGSGPTVFGIFSDGEKAKEAFKRMTDLYPDACRAICSFANGGEND